MLGFFPALNGAVVIVVCVAVVHLFLSRSWRARHPYPPGPPAHPFIGHLLSVPPVKMEHTFAEWGKKYGSVIHLSVLGKHIVVLNTLQAARDLMDKKSGIYSDRHPSVLITELMGWGSVISNLRYGERLRRTRRYVYEGFSKQAVQSYLPMQTLNAQKLLDGLMRTPGDWPKHVKSFTASTILSVTYGYQIQGPDDVFLQTSERATARVLATQFSAMVNFFPWLKHMPTWMPGAAFKRDALAGREDVFQSIHAPFRRVKQEMAAGTAIPSFTSKWLENLRQPGSDSATDQDEADVRNAAGTIYAAAAESSSAIITKFILAMTLYPAVFAKCQEEMDTVLGVGKFPTISDEPSLPYLAMTMKELLRWHVISPLGLPHRVMEDDIYLGYHIPKDAIVVANIWAICEDCVSPKEFIPERYLDAGNDGLPDPTTFTFGFGRRVCPGKEFGMSNIWLAVANMIATLDISKALDGNGEEITPSIELTDGFSVRPKPFVCSIKPRSEQVRRLVSEAVAVSQ